ncbi:hypothetical protein PUN28_019653 [Cardiocondyla obscurior]|uniref:Uncharacterized protein n=1 Tax=Cardiocondyla obscurior TaxID=286306 RepID=A0AAW2EAL2_9HYME
MNARTATREEDGEAEVRGEETKEEDAGRRRGEEKERRRERRSGCPWMLADRRPPAVNDLTTLLYPAPLRSLPSLPSLRFASSHLASPRLASPRLAWPRRFAYPARVPPSAAAAATTFGFPSTSRWLSKKVISRNLG